MAIVKFQRPTPNTPLFANLPGMEALPNRLRRLFEEPFFGMEPAFTQTIGVVPPAEIVENKNELVLTLELPGMTKKDVEVAFEEGVLTIRGEKTETRKEGDEERKYHLWERTYGSFTRSFTLPNTVDPTAIAAAFENGILTIKLPKTAEAKAKGRKIEVVEK